MPADCENDGVSDLEAVLDCDDDWLCDFEISMDCDDVLVCEFVAVGCGPVVKHEFHPPLYHIELMVEQ